MQKAIHCSTQLSQPASRCYYVQVRHLTSRFSRFRYPFTKAAPPFHLVRLLDVDHRSKKSGSAYACTSKLGMA